MTYEEEGGVADTAGGGDDLSTAPVYRFLSKAGVEYPELDPSNRCTNSAEVSP